MPGVLRPYSLADVLGTINQQLQPPAQGSVTGLGLFEEVDEAATTSDAAPSTTVAPPTTWDNGVWGASEWS